MRVRGSSDYFNNSSRTAFPAPPEPDAVDTNGVVLLSSGPERIRMGLHARRILPGLLVAVLQSLWPTPNVWAQADRPLPLPKVDVTVTYRFDKMPYGGPKKLRITYAKGGELVRVDIFRWVEAKNPSRWNIFDRSRDRLITVQAEPRTYTEGSIGSSPNPGALIGTDMRFSRQGTDTVAHAPCTDWKVEAPGQPNDQDIACVTDDGIVLRLASKRPSVASLIAIDIRYGAPQDDLFDPPKGFTRERSP